MQTDTFRTPISIPEQAFRISHTHSLCCMGSCFAENMGGLFAAHKFQVSVNPTGILFNPLSIADSLNRAAEAADIEEGELFFHDGCWHHPAFHSRFSHPDKNVCLNQLRQSVQQTHAFLQHTDLLILTFGSNGVYRLKESGEVVANCHKLPAERFERQQLKVEAMRPIIENALLKVKSLQPSLRCLLTVSPVRYLQTDFSDNSYSKACLRMLAHDLCESHSWISYFPAFEILMDDLRDYRFYAADRIHPSEEAVRYLWDCFGSAFFTEETRTLNRRIEAVEAAFHHRTAFPGTEEDKRFRARSLEQLRQLRREHPYLDFSEEETHFLSL
ncbi:MAG: GSCFA domain-containing protein [Bacteroidales bacterium]|nr:GSCFA domain-containing protein [Bacteroidales bacterium]